MTAVSTARRFGRHEGGAVAIIAAILFPLILAALGLGMETGLWYMSQRKLQHLADVAAHAGAVERRKGPDATAIRAVATATAVAGGHSGAGTTTTVTPSARGDSLSVEVELERVMPRLFSGFFVDGAMVVRARALARVQGDGASACVLALSPDASRAVNVAGSAQVNLEGCDLMVASNATNSLSFGAQITIREGCAYTRGGVEGAQNLRLLDTGCTTVRQIVNMPSDPYQGLQYPTQAHCGGQWNGLTVRCFGDLVLEESNLHSNSIYLITGRLSTRSNSELSASNVSFVLNGSGYISIQGNANMQFTAPTGGPLAGILFSGAQPASSTNDLRGTPGTVFGGTIYFPQSAVSYSGNSAANCTSIVAHRITFTGNSAMNCRGNPSQQRDYTSSNVALVE
ncbi:TadE/TadG family type IV pilus assembly protein [Halodurantibacterium flavum]|uniref:TadE/TadG family type IV pilus assembly protein n=1 Tax=Halodurantibacterium flavum TaxID=1382802 RepID=A0ABW4S7N9_9RHOB